MKTTIVTAGGIRSGSTWQFNVVRTALLRASNSVYGAWISDYDESRGEACHVVKAHQPVEIESVAYDAVVTCYRDIRDVIASAQRMRWQVRTRREVAGVLDRYIEDLTYWEGRAVCVTRYEDAMTHPLAEMRRISNALGLRLSQADIYAVQGTVNSLTPPSSSSSSNATHYDRQTLLHPEHISRSFVSLDPEMLAFIEKMYGDWLEDRGYLTARSLRESAPR